MSENYIYEDQAVTGELQVFDITEPFMVIGDDNGSVLLHSMSYAGEMNDEIVLLPAIAGETAEQLMARHQAGEGSIQGEGLAMPPAMKDLRHQYFQDRAEAHSEQADSAKMVLNSTIQISNMLLATGAMTQDEANILSSAAQIGIKAADALIEDAEYARSLLGES